MKHVMYGVWGCYFTPCYLGEYTLPGPDLNFILLLKYKECNEVTRELSNWLFESLNFVIYAF
jgi:hypothetical protein